MRIMLHLLIAARFGYAYWYPNSYTRTPSPEEDCYSDASDPYSATCHNSNDFLYVPCKNLFIPSTVDRPNNFTYFSICTFPDVYDEGDFWSDVITVEVCENYWDACISDNPLSKYDESVEYGRRSCKKVTDSACGPHRVLASSIPGSQPNDTTLGAFDLGPYSTVYQVTVPRGSMPTSTMTVPGGITGSTSSTGFENTSAASKTTSAPTSFGISEPAIRSSQSYSFASTIATSTPSGRAGRSNCPEFRLVNTAIIGLFGLVALLT